MNGASFGYELDAEVTRSKDEDSMRCRRKPFRECCASARRPYNIYDFFLYHGRSPVLNLRDLSRLITLAVTE